MPDIKKLVDGMRANPASAHYAYRVLWSAEDNGYVATVAELPSISWVADSPNEALLGVQKVVADIIADMEETGEAIPEAISDRSFSGKFQVRLPPEAHRKLAIEAAEQHVSLNRLVSSRLS